MGQTRVIKPRTDTVFTPGTRAAGLVAFVLMLSQSSGLAGQVSRALVGLEQVRVEVIFSPPGSMDDRRAGGVETRLGTVARLELSRFDVPTGGERGHPTMFMLVSAFQRNDSGLVSYHARAELTERGVTERAFRRIAAAAQQGEPGSLSSLEELLVSEVADDPRFGPDLALQVEGALRSNAWSNLLRSWRSEGGAVTTWATTPISGSVGPNNLQETLEDVARELAQDFADAWLSSNPRR